MAKTTPLAARIDSVIAEQFTVVAKLRGMSISALLEESCQNTVMAFDTNTALEALEQRHQDNLAALNKLADLQRQQSESPS